MKKVILGAAALLFTMGMYAQNPEPAAPNPIAPSAPTLVPNMGPDPDANTGLSTQTGNAQKVNVLQIGTRQSVLTNQGNGTGSGSNEARISQTGQVQPTSGVENAAEVYQRGTENQSTTWQQGDENQALTRQGQNNTASSENKAFIQQGTGQQAQFNRANVNQDGNENLGLILQTFDRNIARADQTGDENKSSIVQIANPNLSDGHRAGSEQVGVNNQSWIHQTGNGARNVGDVYQDGDDNYADQRQVNTALQGGAPYNDMNEAAISQIVNVYDGSLGGLLGALSALQAGTLNGGGIGESFGGIAFQVQNGTENDVEAYQGGSAAEASNYSEQNQSGTSNDAVVFQNATLTGIGGGNYARQDQVGNDNEAGIAQGGVNHKAYQRQFGNENYAISSQIGDGNCVNTYQEGDMNWASTTQAGEHNQILLVQKDGQSYTAVQNGMGNQANILQLAPGSNPAAILCEFPDQLIPQAPLDIPGFALTAPCPDC